MNHLHEEDNGQPYPSSDMSTPHAVQYRKCPLEGLCPKNVILLAGNEVSIGGPLKVEEDYEADHGRENCESSIILSWLFCETRLCDAKLALKTT